MTIPMVNSTAKNKISLLWILPIIALITCIWFLWIENSKKENTIQIIFNSGDGIQVNKTTLQYKGVNVGKVVDITINSDSKEVLAKISIDKKIVQYIGEESTFWLVKPEVSFNGITGIETLVAGNYIGSNLIEGKKKDIFKALDSPPILPIKDINYGKYIILESNSLGSLTKGSPIYFQEVVIGNIINYELSKETNNVLITGLIDDKYKHFITNNSKFWRVSGINVSAGFSGFKVEAESLTSLLIGGVSMINDKKNTDDFSNQNKFKLYENFKEANTGFIVSLRSKDITGIKEQKTNVFYRGISIGVVYKIETLDDYSESIIYLSLDPGVEKLLTSDSSFWIEKPVFSLNEVSGLESLIEGNYINVFFGDSLKLSNSFELKDSSPILVGEDTSGFNYKIVTNDLGSIRINSPILYKQIPIGKVKNYSLIDNNIIINIHIRKEFNYLVNSSSYFWNISGIKFDINLSGIEFFSESLKSIINGGIALETENLDAPKIKKDYKFSLFKNKDTAVGDEIYIHTFNTNGLKKDSKIKFKGMTIGSIKEINFKKDTAKFLITGNIFKLQDYIFNNSAQFILRKSEISFAGLSNLDSLVEGSYIEVILNNSSNNKDRLKVNNFNLSTEVTLLGSLNLILSSKYKGSLKKGMPILYRGFKIGEVKNIKLSSNSKFVLTEIIIESKYKNIITSGSKFWRDSGFSLKAGLFSGIDIKTKTIESIIEGAISVSTPELSHQDKSIKAKQNQSFFLYDEIQEEWKNWNPEINIVN